MALYAIGDLHLAFECGKTMDIYGGVWVKHEKKIEKYWNKVVTEDDTVVVVGDHSWGRKLKYCRQDLEFICDLPGKKVMIRGNHDMFWDAKKTDKLNEEYKDRLFFLQNNYYPYGEYALVGTKGYVYEGKDTREHCEMIIERECKRLRASFEAAEADGYKKFIMFLHYPPTEIGKKESRFTMIAKAYGVSQIVYAHCHGEERFHDSLLGKVGGIKYSLVSGDYLVFKPQKILD